jgi:hypothetical protein
MSALGQARIEGSTDARARHVDAGVVTEMARSLRRDARLVRERTQRDRLRRAEAGAIETVRARSRARTRRFTPLAAPPA